MKTLEMLKNEYYYITLGDLIDDKWAEVVKAKGWRKMNPAREDEVMEIIAAELGTTAAELWDYYLQ